MTTTRLLVLLLSLAAACGTADGGDTPDARVEVDAGPTPDGPTPDGSGADLWDQGSWDQARWGP